MDQDPSRLAGRPAPVARSNGWPFAGRQHELAAILERMRGGAGAVVLSRPAGVGKSRLAARVLAELGGAGWSTETVRGTSSARDTPYGALAHLLPVVMPAEVVNPLRWAVDQVAPGRKRRRLLLVDDAHQLDAASAAVVNHLVEQHRATVLATVRTGEPAPDAIAALWRGDIGHRVELEPLSADDTARILRGALSGEVEPAAAERLWQLSEGNALLLREIVLAARDSAALVGPPWRLVAAVPVRAPVLLELVNSRVGALGEAEADVLDYVALAEPLATESLEQLCPAAAIERCERRQLIRVTDTETRPQVWLAHPIYGEAIRSGDRPLGVKRRYRALVEVIEKSPDRSREQLRLAMWRLEAGVPQDPATLTVAARIAWAAHDHVRATRLAAAAADAGAGVEATTLLATLFNYAGQIDRAAEVLASVTSDEITPKQLTDLTLTRADNLAMTPGRLGDALAELARVRQDLDDVELRQNLQALQISLLGLSGDNDRLLTLSTALLDAPPVTPELLAQARTFYSEAVGMRGRYLDAQNAARAALDSIDSWRDAVPVIVVPLHMNWMSAALGAGDLVSAELALDGLALETAGRFGWQMVDNALRLGRAHLLIARGRFRDAAAIAGSADPGIVAGSCQAARAQALALSGDTASAGQALEQASAPHPGPIIPMERDWLAIAETWVHAASGDIDAALRCALAQAERSIQAGTPAFAMIALHSAVRLGAAVRVVDRLAELVSRMQGPLPELVGTHARAAADRDGPALLSVADGFATLGFLPYAAEAAGQAADVFSTQRGPGSAAARRAAARATELSRQCQHLDSLAVRRLTAPDLSTRERQVARLAAAGRTSQEIADDLVLSVRTVENHLQHAYTKLGVSGRNELSGLI